MKTIKITFIALSMFFFLGIAKADEPKRRALFSMKFSITAFIDADTRGFNNGVTDIIANNAKFSIVRGDDMWSFNKKQYLDFLEHLIGLEQNCETSYKTVETFNNYVIIKVEMKYPTFTRYNYVTMSECSEGWKITNVSSIFTK